MKQYSRLFPIAALLLTACQTVPYQPYARSVKMQPQKGGVVAVKTEHRPEDRAAADGIMKQTCNPGVPHILEEGEVVTGTVTTSSAKEKEEKQVTVGSLFGIPVHQGEDGKRTTTESATSAQKEWQISYSCKALRAKNTQM